VISEVQITDSEIGLAVSLCVMLLDSCNTAVNICLIVDFFEDQCSEDAADECSVYRPQVPLSQQFNSVAFTQYCRYLNFDYTH